MPTITEVPPVLTLEEARTPYEFLLAWSLDNVRQSGGVPSPEALREVTLALHAIEEFLIEPIAQVLKKVADEDMPAADREDHDPIPESERAVNYADIGRLIVFTDEARIDCDYLLDSLAEITLLAHEDLQAIASGMRSDNILEDPEWSARMRRFHGLDRTRGNA